MTNHAIADSTQDKTWQKNAPSQIVLDSIFAALAAVLVSFSVQDPLAGTWHKFLELLSSLFSFLLFARSAEGTANALDDKDVRQYVYYLLWYNMAVILLVTAVAVLVYAYFSGHFLSFLHRNLYSVSGSHLGDFINIAYIMVFLVVLKPWICDFVWLMFVSKATFDQYLAELEDKIQPVPSRSWLCRLFYRYRNNG